MTRPREDLQRHTTVDHQPGGPAIQFEIGAWCAIDTVHVRSDRVNDGITAYETLIEQARKSSAKARTAAVLRSHDDRRVLAIVDINSHDGFAHLKSAWDDERLFVEQRNVAESSTLALYQANDLAGHPEIDPVTKDTYGFEHIPQPPKQLEAVIRDAKVAEGFRGVMLFASDDGTQSIVICRFELPAQLSAQRPNATRVYPVKTFPRV